MRTHLRLIAGRPLTVEQQGAVLRNAFTLQRYEEAADDVVEAVNQVLQGLGWLFFGALVLALVFLAVAAVLSLGVGS